MFFMGMPRVLQEKLSLSALHVFLELWILTLKLYNNGTRFWLFFAWWQFLWIHCFSSYYMCRRYDYVSFYLIAKSRKLQLLIFSWCYLKIFSTFFLFIVQDYKCININWAMTTTLVLFRSLNDLVYFLNILLQVISQWQPF